MSASAEKVVSLFAAPPDVTRRDWEIERDMVRGGIRRCKSMRKGDLECLMYLTNLWFYHRGSDGFIRPGSALVAKRLGCSIRTAKTRMKTLRDAGYLVPIAYEKGGSARGRSFATWYFVDVGKILQDMVPVPSWGCDQWEKISGRSARFHQRANEIASRAKLARCYKGKEQDDFLPRSDRPIRPPDSEIREAFDDPSDTYTDNCPF